MKQPIIKMSIPTKEYIKNNPKLVTMKPTEYEDVFILKYSRKVFHKYLWDETLVECRGTLVDSEMNVVSRPFTKIFNYDEPFAPKFDDTERVYISDKINGFMACATWHNNELIVSTSGTTWSEFAKVARDYIEKNVNIKLFTDNPELSFIFEICTPEDVHVIKEKFGVYLLGARVKHWMDIKTDLSEISLDYMVSFFAKDDYSDFYRPTHSIHNYKDVKEIIKTYKREGFVVTSCTDSSKQIKMKSPYYLTIKFLSRLNNLNVLKLLENEQAVKSKIDEEFFDIVDHLKSNLELFKSFDHKEKAIYIMEFFDGKCN